MNPSKAKANPDLPKPFEPCTMVVFGLIIAGALCAALSPFAREHAAFKWTMFALAGLFGISFLFSLLQKMEPRLDKSNDRHGALKVLEIVENMTHATAHLEGWFGEVFNGVINSQKGGLQDLKDAAAAYLKGSRDAHDAAFVKEAYAWGHFQGPERRAAIENYRKSWEVSFAKQQEYLEAVIKADSLEDITRIPTTDYEKIITATAAAGKKVTEVFGITDDKVRAVVERGIQELKRRADQEISGGIAGYKDGKQDEALKAWRYALFMYKSVNDHRSLRMCFNCFDWKLVAFENNPVYSPVCSQCGSKSVMRMG